MSNFVPKVTGKSRYHELMYINQAAPSIFLEGVSLPLKTRKEYLEERNLLRFHYTYLDTINLTEIDALWNGRDSKEKMGSNATSKNIWLCCVLGPAAWLASTISWPIWIRWHIGILGLVMFSRSILHKKHYRAFRRNM